MNASQFGVSAPGKLIKAGHGKASYVAFVPDPLPPNLDRLDSLMGAIEDAVYAVGQLNGLGRLLPNPHLFIQPFIRKEALFSSKIEGTQTELETVMAYEAKELAGGKRARERDADVQEVLNYVDALEYGRRRLDELPLSGRLMTEMHALLLDGVRGQHATPGSFRVSQNWIGPPQCTLNEATYVPPPVDEMKDCLGDLERYLNDDPTGTSRLIRLGLVHYQFEAIHPFIDGNGRIGRLLVTLISCHWGLLSSPLMYLSAFFERNRDEYYARLLGVSTQGDWIGWLRFFLQGVTEQANDAVDRAKRLQDLQVEYRERAAAAGSSAALGLVVEQLFATPVVTISSMSKSMRYSYQTARNNMNRLVEVGILSEHRASTRPMLYVARDILDIVS